MENTKISKHFAVVTVSDSCHQGTAIDRSGPRLEELIKSFFDNPIIIRVCVPDVQITIKETLEKLKDGCNVIFTTGGTGFAPRDVTPEATRQVIDKDCPQLTMAIALESLKKTKFAVLSRGVCGIAGKALIINFPGSEKAVVECFEAVREIIPHAINLITDHAFNVKLQHEQIQGTTRHICPHTTGAGDDTDRNSPFEMISVQKALDIVFQTVLPQQLLKAYLLNLVSPVDIPPFRASIKDGYAMKSTGFSGVKKVLSCISAGDKIITEDFSEDECYKINTGAPVPQFADCVVQIEDTRLISKHTNGNENLVEIRIEPKAQLDIRPVGCDLSKGSQVFPSVDHSPVAIKSLLASIGQTSDIKMSKVAVLSTGSELLAPTEAAVEGKIYDSNTTMLEELLKYFGLDCTQTFVLNDDCDLVEAVISTACDIADFIICSGGVSMGDKDFIKPVLKKLGFKIHFGRVNMKPGKPMTFASKGKKYFFGLPGNPVSAFVTFHLFALPAIRWHQDWERSKCELAKLPVILQNARISLDPRPEYMRATVTSKNGRLYASVYGDQMSSRLQSIVGADVLLECPGATKQKSHIVAGETLTAHVLRYDFISKYE